MNQEILSKAEKLINSTDGKICNHCLGRKFSDCVEGDGNEDRGIKIEKLLIWKLMMVSVKYAIISSNILKKMFLI